MIRRSLAPAYYAIALDKDFFMDFMRLLKSLEEFLYEVLSWILFYPATFWRSIRHPSQMMSYADTELSDIEEDQYTDTINPPVFLMLTLVLAHIIEMIALSDARHVNGEMLLDNDTNLLIFRTLVFSMFPLLIAARYLRMRKRKLDRKLLKPPFYAQCYVSAPFALFASLGLIFVRLPGFTNHAIGWLIVSSSLLWHLTVETLWFRSELHISLPRALGAAGLAIGEALLIAGIIAPLAAIL